MAKVSLEFTGDDKDLTAALRRMHADTVKLQEANAKLVQQSKLAAKEAKDSQRESSALFSGMLTGLQSAVAGYFSLSSAARLFNNELAQQKRLQDDVLNRFKSIAQAERELVINAGAVSAGQRDQLLGGVNRIADQNNISRLDALRGAAAGIGFSGQIEPTLAALNTAARFNPFDVAALTPGLVATQNVTRSSDSMSNLGFLIGTQQYSPIKSTSLLTENLIPAAAGVRMYGDTDVEAASLGNALAFALTDVTGQQSGTASQRLAAVLAKQLPELGSTRERIDYLQKNPSAARRAAAGIEQGATKAALVSLISDPTSIANQKYRESLGGIVGPEGRVALAEATIANASGTVAQAVSSQDRSLAAGSENLAFQNPDAANAGSLRSRLDEIMLLSGEGAFASWARSSSSAINTFFGADPNKQFVWDVEAVQRQAKSRGDDSTVMLLEELLKEFRASRQEQPANMNRALRQNSVNDLDRHTEGR